MALPAVRALKRAHAHPGTALVVAAPAKLAALWRACPDVTEVIALERPKAYRPTVATLRGARADAAVLFPNSIRTALEARLAGIGTVYALATGFPRDLFISRVVARPPFDFARLHQKYAYLALAEALGADGGEEDGPFLRLPQATTAADAAGVVLCPGAAYGPAKRWPAARFAEVGRALAERGLGPVTVMGAEGDMAACAEVAEAIPGARNAAGKTPLEAFMAAIAAARLVVTNDSGSMHLAAALGTPGVAVFGSTEPRRTGPIAPCVRVVRYHVPCSPCFRRECPLPVGKLVCLERVAAADVIAACDELLGVAR
jgi:heptosyltransferase-2